MSKNKKPRKKYDPTKRARTDAFGGIRALYREKAKRSKEPLDADQVKSLRVAYHLALTRIVQGQGDWMDLNLLSLAANMALLLCEIGLGADDLPVSLAGQDALMTLTARFGRTGKMVLTGQEARALQALLDLHDGQLCSDDAEEGMLISALAECKDRIAKGNVLEVAA